MKIEKITDYISVAIIIFILITWAYSGLLKPYRVVISDSMEPTIHKGDIVYIVKVRGELHKGDIVLYERPDFPEPILHRIVDVKITTVNNQEIKCYVIKGDNNSVVDPPYPIAPGKTIDCVPENAIIGKEVFRIPYVGKIFFWMFD